MKKLATVLVLTALWSTGKLRPVQPASTLNQCHTACPGEACCYTGRLTGWVCC
ncbi:MAG TPA: hypothetical protein VGM86_03200 [Thermoanaerobaculia bacterium]|jgi:hypothetical protein